MSTYWAVYCETCEETGPQIGRTAGGMTFADPKLPDEYGGTSLARFLIQHDYHPLKLVHE